MSTHFDLNVDLKTFEMKGAPRTVILLYILDGNGSKMGRRHSHPDPTALDSIIEQESNQVSHTHVPHSCTCGDEEDKEVLFAESNIPDNQGKLNPGKEENDPQNRTRKHLKEQTH
jgi:hypothetical protein